jgi:hypothetical protein
MPSLENSDYEIIFFFGVGGVEGTLSFDGAKCVEGHCAAVGIPTTCRPVTL